jgi:hypothetical protein
MGGKQRLAAELAWSRRVRAQMTCHEESGPTRVAADEGIRCDSRAHTRPGGHSDPYCHHAAASELQLSNGVQRTVSAPESRLRHRRLLRRPAATAPLRRRHVAPGRRVAELCTTAAGAFLPSFSGLWLAGGEVIRTGGEAAGLPDAGAPMPTSPVMPSAQPGPAAAAPRRVARRGSPVLVGTARAAALPGAWAYCGYRRGGPRFSEAAFDCVQRWLQTDAARLPGRGSLGTWTPGFPSLNDATFTIDRVASSAEPYLWRSSDGKRGLVRLDAAGGDVVRVRWWADGPSDELRVPERGFFFLRRAR